MHLPFPVFVVDDNRSARVVERRMLEGFGLDKVIECESGEQLLAQLQEVGPGIIFLDLVMPGISGIELLVKVIDTYPQATIIVVSGMGELATAVECMKCGAYDYLEKPVPKDDLLNALRRAIEVHEAKDASLRMRQHYFDDRLDNPELFRPIVTQDGQMRRLCQYCEAIAPSRQAVLITGETGVGKELFARVVHELSGRTGPFVAMDVAAIDAALASDAFFGHVRGAYTSAADHREGAFQRAAGGTLFLDEIGDMSPEVQGKLLRVLQESEYMPLGAERSQRSDVRIVVATNRDLAAMAAENAFRRDLYYRLSTHVLVVPPLRERKDDIPILLDHFIRLAARELERKAPRCPDEVYTYLQAYTFPGNVRELRSIAFNAVATCRAGILSVEAFQHYVVDHDTHGALGEAAAANITHENAGFDDDSAFPTWDNAIRTLLKEALRRANGNQSMAARLLNLKRTTFIKRCELYLQDA